MWVLEDEPRHAPALQPVQDLILRLGYGVHMSEIICVQYQLAYLQAAVLQPQFVPISNL